MVLTITHPLLKLSILLLLFLGGICILPYYYSHSRKTMRKIYKVTLTTEERATLTALVSTGKNNAQKIKHANILLAADENERGKAHDSDIAKQFHCHANTVANIRERFVEEGLESALERKKRSTPPHTPIFDGRAEAHLIALVPSPKPEGRCNFSPINVLH